MKFNSSRHVGVFVLNGPEFTRLGAGRKGGSKDVQTWKSAIKAEAFFGAKSLSTRSCDLSAQGVKAAVAAMTPKDSKGLAIDFYADQLMLSRALIEQNLNYQPILCMGFEDGNKRPENALEMARHVRLLTYPSLSSKTTVYNGYSLWIWHNGEEWIFSNSSRAPARRTDNAISYIENTSKLVAAGVCGKLPSDSDDIFTTDGTSRFAVANGVRFDSRCPDAIFAPSSIIIDLEGYYLDGKPTNFVSDFIQKIREKFPDTKVGCTTYGLANTYVTRRSNGDVDNITEWFDFIVPQAYHDAYGTATQITNTFGVGSASVTSMSERSWKMLGPKAFPSSYSGAQKAELIYAGMPYTRWASGYGRQTKSKRSRSIGMYEGRVPYISMWWSSTWLDLPNTSIPINNKSRYIADEGNIRSGWKVLVEYYADMQSRGGGIGNNAPLVPSTRSPLWTQSGLKTDGSSKTKRLSYTNTWREVNDIDDIKLAILEVLGLARRVVVLRTETEDEARIFREDRTSFYVPWKTYLGNNFDVKPQVVGTKLQIMSGAERIDASQMLHILELATDSQYDSARLVEMMSEHRRTNAPSDSTRLGRVTSEDIAPLSRSVKGKIIGSYIVPMRSQFHHVMRDAIKKSTRIGAKVIFNLSNGLAVSVYNDGLKAYQSVCVAEPQTTMVGWSRTTGSKPVDGYSYRMDGVDES
jgi:hypothetical protein